jgi:hypothetical protein
MVPLIDEFQYASRLSCELLQLIAILYLRTNAEAGIIKIRIALHCPYGKVGERIDSNKNVKEANGTRLHQTYT